MDLRMGGREWGFEGVRSSLVYVKSLGGGKEVLVLGLRDFMVVYDVRMFGGERSVVGLGSGGGGKGMVKLVFMFLEYKNEVYIYVGLDVLYDLEVVVVG